MARLIELKRRWNLYGNFGSTKFTSLLTKQRRIDHCFESVARQTKVGKIHTARSHKTPARKTSSFKPTSHAILKNYAMALL
jgi:hypothetical protein